MTRISLVVFVVGVGLCLTTAGSWAADDEWAPELDFFPMDTDGPPSEVHLREMLKAGYITQRGFNKATEQLKMFRQYGDQPHDGSGMGMHGGPGMGSPDHMMEPPTEAQLRAMLEDGRIPPGKFEEAMEHFRAYQRGEPPPDGPGMGMHGGPHDHDHRGPREPGGMEHGMSGTPPTLAELQAERDAGHLTPQEYKSHLRDLEAWQHGDAATRQKIMKKHQGRPAPFEASTGFTKPPGFEKPEGFGGNRPAHVIRTQTQFPNVNIQKIRDIKVIQKRSNPPHHP